MYIICVAALQVELRFMVYTGLKAANKRINNGDGTNEILITIPITEGGRKLTPRPTVWYLWSNTSTNDRFCSGNVGTA